MTQKELELKFVSIKLAGSGSYRVTIEYRNHTYSCISNNSLAYDAWRNDDHSYYTEKQALQALYDECKRKNGLR